MSRICSVNQNISSIKFSTRNIISAASTVPNPSAKGKIIHDMTCYRYQIKGIEKSVTHRLLIVEQEFGLKDGETGCIGNISSTKNKDLKVNEIALDHNPGLHGRLFDTIKRTASSDFHNKKPLHPHDQEKLRKVFQEKEKEKETVAAQDSNKKMPENNTPNDDGF